MIATISHDGQVTIPQPVRQQLGLAQGGAVDFEIAADGRVEIKKAAIQPESGRFQALRGRAGKGPGTDAIMAITRGEPVSDTD